MNRALTFRRHRLIGTNNVTFSAHWAGVYFTQRQHWLSEARTSKRRGHSALTISLYADFAKAAHQAYLNELRRLAKHLVDA